MTQRTHPSLAPVEKSIVVPWDVEAAFRRYTERMAEWWPLSTFAVDTQRAVACALEPREGGRLYESWDDGSTHLWGTITEWQPPRRLAYTWHPGRDPETAQSVEVEFEPEGDGCRVSVSYAGWERLGEEAATVRPRYVEGVEFVMGRYASA